ncbi:vitamin K-dependent protein C-like, partial [Sitodiplosis mosellana]|uniref:vitamin K-dependent protein C-like n=1 Tax=Sitodiplosis mosellana TaxID=263140 RepID=UPI002443D1BA
MFGFWTFCVLFTATTAAVLNQPSQFVKINGESLPKNAFTPHFKLKPRIANGNRAELGSFPWHASLAIKYRIDGSEMDPTFCSGTILNEKWILTPAQCIKGAKAIRVDIGSVDINKPLISVYPDAFTLHPQYDNSNNKFKNNLALLRLPEKSKLDFTKSEGRYAPIRLPTRRQIDETFEGMESYFSGFGYPSIR